MGTEDERRRGWIVARQDRGMIPCAIGVEFKPTLLDMFAKPFAGGEMRLSGVNSVRRLMIILNPTNCGESNRCPSSFTFKMSK